MTSHPHPPAPPARPVAADAPLRPAEQPLAVLAYVMWWMGDSRAVAFALRCLMLDEDCSLAAIVCSAYQRGVMPAWMGAGPHHDAA